MTALEAIKRFSFNVVVDSHLPQNLNIEATEGDTVELTHKFFDRQGNALDVTGATATLRIARKSSGWGWLNNVEKTDTDGITLSSNKAVSAFDVDDLDAPGIYAYQLRLTKSGNAIVVAQGDIALRVLIE